VIPYRCETWSLTLRKEHRVRIFGPQRDEVMGGWRKLHNEELHDLYSLPSIIRGRWVDNIKMDLLEIGLSVVDWIGLAQDRDRWRALVNIVMNLQVL
jgi:hypothetical protein